ncbi:MULTISPECIES: hypothetical protein [Novosphingobium]|jgi:hypothetical protein|uniref:hypothetical protein n=1 Tax=Novosphingobium TaxID=165696 RepID=UPI0022F29B26|nr:MULTISPECIES: hypothetical protein [Novosphingobium]GLK45573.1 hypothetical protein GCM10017612_34930 [Novosphingobium resinovorum]
MTRRLIALFGTLALVPAMVGPLQVEAREFVAMTCNGGAVSVPVPAPPGPPQGPCCAKGCHSDSKRKRLDRSQ